LNFQVVEALRKLGAIESSPLASQPAIINLPDFDSFGQRAEELLSMLRLKNGFYAFESALHVFPAAHFEGEMTLSRWNSHGLWRQEYQDLAEGCLFFAEDIFGNQFCIRDGQIGIFDVETGTVDWLASSMEEWAGLILGDYDLHTGYRVAYHWQNQHGPLPKGNRLGLKMLLVFGGNYQMENLYAADAVETMRFRGHIANNIKDLPDGTTVRLQVVDDSERDPEL
jgi:hypothetical protein